MKCSPPSPRIYRSANTTFPGPHSKTLTHFSFPSFILCTPGHHSVAMLFCIKLLYIDLLILLLLREFEVRRESVLANKQKAGFKRQFEGQSQSSPLCDHHHHHCKSQINLKNRSQAPLSKDKLRASHSRVQCIIPIITITYSSLCSFDFWNRCQSQSVVANFHDPLT